ncbi:uncharacterized protein BXZ73DRAFT_106017 [Epithele typhae]|uniref:uncharacterized protein n=1 Tax=Epithele typhae TaxID=378194 RepID=UPI0020071DEF|nr:uncharacterized protein BXZ73DRAFT_106017 [Epithele typhae]KAH9915951.1 hypothetical protein BXZ73DRAFT_106017 [Epithele typhae]
MHSETQPDSCAPIDRIPQELFSLILRWTIQRPGLRSSFSCLVERPNLEPPPGFHSWLPLRLVSRHWNGTIASEKHLWSTIIAGGPRAREWLMVCLDHADGVPIDVILQLDHGHIGKIWSLLISILPRALHLQSLAISPLNKSDRDHLNDFFLSTTFPTLTTLVFASDSIDWWSQPIFPVTFEQHNTPALSTISLNANWQVPCPAIFARLKRVSLTRDPLEILSSQVLGLLRAAPQLEEFRLGCGYYKGSDLDWARGLWYTSVGLPVPVTMAHLRILEFTEEIDKQSVSAWVLGCLRLPRVEVVHLNCEGWEASDIFSYLPHTLADSIPFLSSLVELRVVSHLSSSGLEYCTADRTHRFIVYCDVEDWYLSIIPVLVNLVRFDDRIRRCDGTSTLELDDNTVALFTRQEQWAALLRCFPKLTRLSIAAADEIRLEELAEALRERGEPLAELVLVGEPLLDLEVWREKMEAAGVGGVTRVEGINGGADDWW